MCAVLRNLNTRTLVGIIIGEHLHTSCDEIMLTFSSVVLLGADELDAVAIASVDLFELLQELVNEKQRLIS